MGYEEMAAEVRKTLDERGITYDVSNEGGDAERITIWDHNGFWITYMAYTDEKCITRSRMSVSAGFTKNRRDVDAETFARVIEALS